MNSLLISFGLFIVNIYGGNAFALLQIVLLVCTILSLGLYPILIRISTKIAARAIPIVILCGIFAMVNWIVVATGPFWFILVISALAIGAAAILNFAWLAILIDCTPIQHRNIVYQSYAVALSLGTIIMNWLGLDLSKVIGTVGVFYCVVGILILCLPILLALKVERFHNLIRSQIENFKVQQR